MAERPLRLVELPEEIILQILRNVYDTPIPDFKIRKLSYLAADSARYNQAIRDIQNVRLTSRILSRVGSELLIEYVGVDLSWESLHRFQKIMRHPGIRKGVGMVRIRLPIYNIEFGANEEFYTFNQLESFDFLQYYCRSVHDLGPEAKAFCLWLDRSMRDCPWTQEKVNTAIKHSRREYRDRYASQMALLANGRKKFIRYIAEALKESNNKALRIEITDIDDLPTPYRMLQSVQRAEEGDALDLLLKPAASPSPWRAFATRPDDRPRCLAPMVFEMLAAFQDERINIVDLKLEISMVTESDREMFGKMEPEQEPLRGASAAMRNLRNFTFWRPSSEGQAPAYQQRTRPELSTLLYRCLPSSMRTLKLNSVGLEMLQCRFPGLTQITLEHIAFEGAKSLEHFLQSAETHKIALTLGYCSIFGGSWADVLDFLRAKQRKTCLIAPSAGEFREIEYGWPVVWPLLSPDDADLDMTKGPSPAQRLSGSCFYQYVTRSQQYIRGDCDVNPLRQRPH